MPSSKPDTIKKKSRSMDSTKSFEEYGRMKEFEERRYRQKTRKRLIIISISAFLLLAIIIGTTAVAVAAAKRDGNSSQKPSPTPTIESIEAIITCNATRYPASCYSSMMSSAKGSNTTKDPQEFFKLSLEVAIEALKNFSAFIVQIEDGSLQAAVQDCKELFDDAIDRVSDSLGLLQPAPGEKFWTASRISDLRTWLSAAITDQRTCLDGFEGATKAMREEMEAAMANSTQFTSNSLAIATKILAKLENVDAFAHRRLLETAAATTSRPAWLSSSQRRALLHDSSRPKPNVTVAKDGSGQCRTIKEALDLVPKKSGHPFVIHVKEGVYEEIVSVDKDKWNVTMIGDGMHKTIVTGNLSRAIVNSTMRTATFAALGKGFMAKDMGFRNTAGPKNNQAVALLAFSDLSVFHRCSFDAYQDTLYMYSLRQFYRECDITGTVDFIFGDAAAVLQNCSIRPRQPMPNQRNTITAQGRTDPNENTGIVIQGCTISPHGDVSVPTFLGRPWRDYSTTIVMRSEIAGMVDPLGWLPWDGETAPPDTIYYAEYRNRGPGSNVTGRVKWPGYRPAINRTEAEKFGVDSFIRADDWLPPRGIQFAANV